MQDLYFEYGEKELDYLKSRDKRLAGVIDSVGVVRRLVIPDIFAALVNSIIGQQISTKAQQTIWQRAQDRLGDITPDSILAISAEELKSIGISFRKTVYIRDAALRFRSGEFNPGSLSCMTDEEVIDKLTGLKGIGVWSAEMLMLFSMQRPDILSFGDLAIHRGLRMLYRHREITRKLFEKYRRRFSPYGSIASLYLWEIASGKIPTLEISDCAINARVNHT